MPTTDDVVNQHLKCFYDKDLEGVLTDYASDAVLFMPGGPLRSRAAIKPFFQGLISEFSKPGAAFSMRQQTLTVTTRTSCGRQKPQTMHTKPLPTHSSCGTEKLWRNPLLPKLPQNAE